MKNSIEHIEDFLEGKLSAEEEVAFKLRMEAESEFAKEVEAHRQAHDVVEMYTKIRMKEKVKAIHQNSKARPIFFLKRPFLIAASLLVIIIVSCFSYAKTNYSNPSLIADNIQLITLDQRNISDEGKGELYKNLESAYRANDYDQAIDILSSTPQSSSYNWEQFALGNLYLQVEKSSEAIGVFQSLMESGDIRYLEDAQWLLAIAHLQNDDEENAKLSLENIIQTPDHSLYNQAIEMKKRLNSFWRRIVN